MAKISNNLNLKTMKNTLTRTSFIKALALSLFVFVPFVSQAQGVNQLSKEKIQAALDEAYAKFKDVKEGKNADYIKELAKVDPKLLGISLITTDGQVYTKGDVETKVSTQSISKAFVMAQIIDELGHQAIQDKIGVNATG